MDWNKIIEPKYSDISHCRQHQLRHDFERDHDRIIFSSEFRRLNQKTQVFPMPENYFVHNRMTHSIETSCIGRSLAKTVADYIADENKIEKKDDFIEKVGNIVEAACLAHDIGNPPFGHSGEDAISSFFIKNSNLIFNFTDKQKNDLTNFEGNAQGFRILTKCNSDIELTQNVVVTFSKYPRESLINNYMDIKHSKRKDQKKHGFFQNEKNIFESIATHFELKILSEKEIAFSRFPLSYLVEAADDICYLTIDIEDGVRLGLIPIKEVYELLSPIINLNPEEKNFKTTYDSLDDKNDKMSYMRAKTINSLITYVSRIFKENISKIDAGLFENSLIDLIPDYSIIEAIKKCAYNNLYLHTPVLEIEAAGFDVINGLLDIIFDIKNNPESKRNKKISNLFPDYITNKEMTYEAILLVTDYVSGMTDKFAINLYNSIKGVTLPKLY